MSQDSPAFKIRNANYPLFVLQALTPDLAEFKRQLQAHLAQAPEFLSGAPVVLSLAGIAETVPDFADLVAFMRGLGLQVAGVVGGSSAQREAAIAAGLGIFPDKPARAKPAKVEEVVALPVEPATPPPPPPTPPVQEMPPPRQTLIVDKPVRTGQRIHAEGADLVVLAIVNAGAELIADGDIHVYAPLRGRALAGARGNREARIFAQAMEAELVSIAGLYQVFEDGIPAELRGKPAQVFLDGERVALRPLAPMR